MNFQKLLAVADGDWEYILRTWNTGPANANDQIDEAQARRWASKGTTKNSKYDFSGVDIEQPTTVAGWAGKAYKATTRPVAGDKGEFFDLNETMKTFLDAQGDIKWDNLFPNILLKAGEEVTFYLEQERDLLAEINEKTGLTGRLSRDFRREIMLAQPYAISLGVSFQTLSEMVSETVAQSGKFKLLSTETISQMALASKFIENTKDIATYARNFELVGIGVGTMAKYIQQAAMSSLNMGLNTRTVTKTINDSLSNLNRFGFKDGVDGLTRMAQKSIELRMNMNEAFKLADQVWNPDQALDLVANLQVLGTAVGDLNDPLKLMYMATNDVEGLQKAITESTKSLVTFNAEQGKFEITGVNLRRAREQAQLMGLDYNEMANGAIAAAERMQASNDLMSRGFNVDEEDKKFLTNLARMEGGKMVISIPENLQDALGGTQVALSDLTQTQYDTLKQQKEAFKELKPEDYARQQVGALDNISRDISFIRAAVRVGLGQQVGEAIENLTGGIGDKLSKESKEGRNAVYGQLEKYKVAGGMIPNIVSQAEMMKQVEHIAAESKASKKLVTSVNLQPDKENGKIGLVPDAATTKVEFQHVIKWSDGVTEPMKRAMFNDQIFQADIEKSYEARIGKK